MTHAFLLLGDLSRAVASHPFSALACAALVGLIAMFTAAAKS